MTDLNSKERIRSSFRELTQMVGVSGSEQAVVKYLKAQLKNYADEVKVDVNGNVIAVKYGKKSGPKVMITAHSDEIGMTVKNILDDGFIVFDKIGGIQDNLIQGRKVWITERKIPGVIGVKPGHLTTDEERRQVPNIRKCFIDVGASSKEEVLEMGIKIGDQVVFKSDFMEMANKDLIATKSVDNRISCAILIDLFYQMKDAEFAGSMYGVVTVQEEVGLRGATMVANQINPDYAIVLDTIPAGDTPDIHTETNLPIYLGKGPVCPIADGALGILGFTRIHPTLKKIIEEQSKIINVPVQYVTLVGNRYITDASSIAISSKGIPVAVIATPRRYSHSPVELVHLNDAIGTLKLIKAIVLNNGYKEISFI